MSIEIAESSYGARLRDYASNLDHHFYRLTDRSSPLLEIGYSSEEVKKLQRACSIASDLQGARSRFFYVPEVNTHLIGVESSLPEQYGGNDIRYFADHRGNEALYVLTRLGIHRRIHTFPILFNLAELFSDDSDPFNVFAQSVAIHQVFISYTEKSSNSFEWGINNQTGTLNLETDLGSAVYRALSYQDMNSNFFVKVPHSDIPKDITFLHPTSA